VLKHFTLPTAVEGIPAGSVLTVNTAERKLIQGETFALRDRDGDCFIIRVDEVRAAKKTVGGDRCEIVGRVVSWEPVLH
jgi:hypothetical protein